MAVSGSSADQKQKSTEDKLKERLLEGLFN